MDAKSVPEVGPRFDDLGLGLEPRAGHLDAEPSERPLRDRVAEPDDGREQPREPVQRCRAVSRDELRPLDAEVGRRLFAVGEVKEVDDDERDNGTGARGREGRGLEQRTNQRREGRFGDDSDGDARRTDPDLATREIDLEVVRHLPTLSGVPARRTPIPGTVGRG